MLKDVDFVVKSLLAIERKYVAYFKDKDFTTAFCVEINWNEPVSIRVINHILPFEITCAIEEMFWVEPDKKDDLDNLMADIRFRVKKYNKLLADFKALCDNLKQAHKKQQALFEKIRNVSV